MSDLLAKMPTQRLFDLLMVLMPMASGTATARLQQELQRAPILAMRPAPQKPYLKVLLHQQALKVRATTLKRPMPQHQPTAATTTVSGVLLAPVVHVDPLGQLEPLGYLDTPGQLDKTGHQDPWGQQVYKVPSGHKDPGGYKVYKVPPGHKAQAQHPSGSLIRSLKRYTGTALLP